MKLIVLKYFLLVQDKKKLYILYLKLLQYLVTTADRKLLMKYTQNT